MTLAEKLLLLCWDAERGVPAAHVHPRRLRRGLAAAILAELVLHRRIEGTAEALRIPDDLPNYTALASEGAAILRRARSPLSASEAVRRFESRLPRLRARIVASLVGRDVLHEYGVSLFQRHPVRSMQALQQAYAELQSCAHHAAAPGVIALAALLNGAGLLDARASAADAVAIRFALMRARDDKGRDGTSADLGLLLAIAAAAAPD